MKIYLCQEKGAGIIGVGQMIIIRDKNPNRGIKFFQVLSTICQFTLIFVFRVFIKNAYGIF